MTTTTISPAIPRIEQRTSAPSKHEVIDAIIRDAAEAGLEISRRTASYLDSMMAKAAAEIRGQEDEVGNWRSRLYYLTDRDMRKVHDSGVLDKVMPDERTVPTDGSAHDLLGRRHLQGMQLSFVHTFGEARGGRYCALAIAVDTTDAA